MRRWIVALGLVACGQSATTPDGALTQDATPFVPGPNTVMLHVDFASPFVMYRDGRGGWGVPVRHGETQYALQITNDYEVVVVCSDDVWGFDATLYRRTFADGDSFTASCIQSFFEPTGPTTPVVRVSGTMLQRGSVWFGNYDYSTTAPWSYAFEVPAATYDLFAHDDARMLIRRRREITADTVEPPIDLAQGASLAMLPFTVNANADEQVVVDALLMSTHGWTFLEGTSTHLRMPPDELLEPDDVIEVSAYAYTETTNRRQYLPYSGSQPFFTLMPVLEDIVFSLPNSARLYATWSTLPDFDSVALSIGGYEGSQWVMATRTWFEATGAKHIAFDPVPPDYFGGWHVRLSTAYWSDITVYEQSPVLGFRSTRLDYTPPP